LDKSLNIKTRLVQDNSQRAHPECWVVRDANRRLGVVTPKNNVTTALMENIEPAPPKRCDDTAPADIAR
jgi:hypothetical protein